jgi:hypothetical protein
MAEERIASEKSLYHDLLLRILKRSVAFGGIQPPGSGNRPKRLKGAFDGELADITTAGQESIDDELGPSGLRAAPLDLQYVSFDKDLLVSLAKGPEWVWVQLAAAELFPHITLTSQAKQSVTVRLNGAAQDIELIRPADGDLKTAVEHVRDGQVEADAKAKQRKEQIFAQASDAALSFALGMDLHNFVSDHILHLFDVLELVLARPLYESKRILDVDRPAVLAKPHGIKIKKVIPVPKHQSLPSGHAAYSHALTALVAPTFNLLSTPKIDYLNSLAMRTAENRQLAGLHTHLDTQEGVKLGTAIGAWIHSCVRDRPSEFPALTALVAVAQIQWVVGLT